ncbi:MAG: hypothetical protein MK085_05740 [Phycisphaerales bacterium]|nr:hypothetical protein [Phycisphaerales bacterium]
MDVLRRNAQVETPAPPRNLEPPIRLQSTFTGTSMPRWSLDDRSLHEYAGELASAPLQKDAIKRDDLPPAVIRAYVRGRALLVSGNYGQARPFLEQAVNGGGGPSALRALADVYDRLGRASGAAGARMTLLERGAASGEDLVALGEYLLWNRRHDEAIEMFATAIQISGSDPGLLLAAGGGLVEALSNAGKAGEAARCRQMLIRELAESVEPTSLPPGVFRDAVNSLWLEVGDDLALSGAHAEAVETWRRLGGQDAAWNVDLRSRLIWSLVAMGRPLFAQLEFVDATLGEQDIELLEWLRDTGVDLAPLIKVLENRQAGNPDDLLLVRLLAVASPERAGDILRQAVMETNDPTVRADLVGIALEAGPETAVGTAAEIATNIESMRAVELSLLEGSHGEEALLAAAEQLAEEGPAHAAFVARLLSSLERPDLAWRYAIEVLERDPSNVPARVEAIRAAGLMHEPGLLELVAQEPFNPYVEAARVRALAASGELATALSIADAAVGMFPSSGEVFEARGRLKLMNPEDSAAALEDLLAAVRMGRHDARTWYEAIRLATAAQDAEAAAAIRSSRASVADASTVDRLLEAQQAMSRGRYTEAERILRTIADQPQLRDVVMGSLFLAWKRMGRLDAARTWLMNRIRIQPSVPAWRRGLAWVDAEEGRLEDTIQGLREVAAGARSGVPWRMLEDVTGQVGLVRQRDAIARARLERQPWGIGRDIELARIDVAEDAAAAMTRLVEVAGANPTSLQRRMAIELAVELPLEMRSEVLAILAAPYLAGDLPVGPFEGRVLVEHLPEDVRQVFLDSAQPARPTPWSPDDTWLMQSVDLARTGRFADATDLAVFRIQGGIPRSFPDPVAMVRPMFAYALLAGWDAPRLVGLLDELESSGVDVLKGIQGGVGVGGESWLLVAAGLASTLGTEQTAIGLLEIAALREPERPSVLNNFGYSLMEEGRDLERAAAVIEEAWLADPSGASELDSLGWLRYKQGRNDPNDNTGALAYLDRSIARRRLLGREIPLEVLLHVGDASWRGGRKHEAVVAWNAIIETRGSGGISEQILGAYADWLRQSFGSEIVDPAEIWEREDGRWIKAARRRIKALSEDEPPPLVPTWAELEERERTENRGE